MSTRAALIFFLSCLVIGLMGLGIAAWIKYGPPITVADRIVSRKDFEAYTVTHQTSFVTSKFGPPDRTRGVGGGREQWFYFNRTRDGNSGRIDSEAELEVEGGVVFGVKFR